MIWAIEKTEWDKILAMMALNEKIALPEFMAVIGSTSETSGNVAVIAISGMMMKNPSAIERFYLGAIDTQEIIAQVNAAAADNSISGIVLNISSPGGTVSGTPELANTVQAACKKKAVMAYVDDLCASAAYWVAAQTQGIYTSKQAVVGSIGVRMAMYDTSKAYEQAGVKVIPIDTGKFKSAGMAGTEVTDEQIQMYQDIVDAHFRDFKSAVMSGRGMDESAFANVQDAQLFHASKAKSVGLIDGISSLADVIKQAGKRPSGRSTQTSHERLKLYS